MLNDKLRELVAEVKQELEELDENELNARIDLNAAFKKYDHARTERELKLQKLRLLMDAAVDDK